jgi:outer membrane protein assembly factor BamD (BamD/ComL family)
MRSDSTKRSFALVIALALASCAGQQWDQVRAQDATQAYRRFVAEHPNSPHAAEAKERIAVLQLERDPTSEALARFRSEHPDSEATAHLTRRLEARAFEAARAEATPVAYDRFLATFPSSEFAARASGNATYLRAGGFAARADALAAFVQQHPASDYTTEAQRTLAGVDARRSSRWSSVGLRIEIAAGVGEADRLRNLFAERAREAYAAAGISLVDGPATATLTIRHDERAASAHDQDGRLTKPGVVAETTVSLQRNGDAEPIWTEQFSQRIPDADHRAGGSALFAQSAAPYWDRFFVPIANWPTQLARRSAWNAGGELAGVTGDVGRAIALSPNGNFRELDLSDPTAPRVVASYQRPSGIASYSGVRRVGNRIVLFGEDGLVVVARQGGAYRLVFELDRGTAGAVASVEEVDGRLLAAGTRGLLRTALDGGPVERLFERPLRGIARSGDTLLVIDDQWLYTGSARDPRPAEFVRAAELGRGLAPRGIRVGGGIAVVLGLRGVACFDVSAGRTARAFERPKPNSIGSVTDAVVQGGAIFLLGERGLQVLDPSGGRIIDAVDVKGRSALDTAGGHVVAIGGNRLEVVDVAPWITRAAPAAPAR